MVALRSLLTTIRFVSALKAVFNTTVVAGSHKGRNGEGRG